MPRRSTLSSKAGFLTPASAKIGADRRSSEEVKDIRPSDVSAVDYQPMEQNSGYGNVNPYFEPLAWLEFGKSMPQYTES